jgi:hypothetical protein
MTRVRPEPNILVIPNKKADRSEPLQVDSTVGELGIDGMSKSGDRKEGFGLSRAPVRALQQAAKLLGDTCADGPRQACGWEFEDSGRDRPTFRDRCRRLETAALGAEGFGWWQRWHEWLGPDGGTATPAFKDHRITCPRPWRWPRRHRRGQSLPPGSVAAGNIAVSSAAAAGSVHYRVVGVQGECDRSVGVRCCHPLRPLFAISVSQLAYLD